MREAVASAIGELVRHWRRYRRLSQADLAEAAEVSTRHVSCVERGRARPSRQMVLILASALEVPLRERNTMLRAAGFPPVYRQTALDAPQMTAVRKAIGLLLDNHAPYPAIVIDPSWNVLLGNDPWRTLCALVLPGPEPIPNVVRAIFEPGPLRSILDNWEEVARATLARVRREAMTEGDEALDELYNDLIVAPDLPRSVLRDNWDVPPALLIPVRLRIGGDVLSLFTTLTTLGTPTDITLSELRIEQYFPADEATDRWLRETVGS